MSPIEFLPPGLHQVTAERYHADRLMAVPTLSSSLARLIIHRSPLHAWTAAPRLNPTWQGKDSKTFDIGRAAHRIVLGNGDDYTVIPEEILAANGAASTKEAKAFIAECREHGVTPIKAEEDEALRSMASKCAAKLGPMGIRLDGAYSEIAGLAVIDGVAVRALFDNAPPDDPWLIDFKTTQDASPDACIRSVASYGYDLQIAHYLDTWETITGERRRMLLVFQEKEPPFEVSVVELHDNPDSDSDWMLAARDKAATARRIWAECLATGVWPGYPSRIALVGSPAFHTAKWEGRAKPSAAAIRAATEGQAP